MSREALIQLRSTPGREQPDLQPRQTPFQAKSIPVFHNLQPHFYDGYEGTEAIPARVSYVLTQYESQGLQNAVIRLADMWIDPYQTPAGEKTSEANAATPEPATIIYIGGGDSDALASTGLVGYMRDAQKTNIDTQQQGQWYAQNVITVSHPTGAPRTQTNVADENMTPSAHIIKQALDKAMADGSIHTQKIVLMGSSAGGALATELAVLMVKTCHQLILEEPAAMAEHPTIQREFLTSGFYAAYKTARGKGKNPLQAARFAARDVRLSWTLPYGAPKNWRELMRSLFQPNPDYLHLGKIFRLPHPVEKSGLNANALGHDTTEQARSKITIPVTLVASLKSSVVNLLRDKGEISMRRLSRMNTSDPKTLSQLEQISTTLIQDLFPASKRRTIALVDGYDHSGLGRNSHVWGQLLSEVQKSLLSA